MHSKYCKAEGRKEFAKLRSWLDWGIAPDESDESVNRLVEAFGFERVAEFVSDDI